ncbi:Intradiol ring-cleavage dioxygenase [Massariosphaeria phaeospora]|uniref:Intradiol ring-cleavage dioxygenase n=1 Tax=Massariosphaeria phaeospora TaxID=100035 RepID=A0A7C8ILF2_9PLEO|nr:Intradiol ring-cleavage dioxygenase [Massariosphaeria phaeospora]
MLIAKLLATAAAVLSAVVSAHPELSKREMAEYREQVARDTEALGRCLESREMQETNVRMLEERATALHHLRKARGVDARSENHQDRRDLAALVKWNNLTHEQANWHSKDPQDLFNFRWTEEPRRFPAGCILTPESVYGPFFSEGHLERQYISAGQQGVDLRLALQVIDIATCKPVENTRVDIWHTNAMGQYSTTNTSYLRGWQPTSKWGTVDFDTKFPGHYYNRATHIHVAVRKSLTEQRRIHTGQLFFDNWVRGHVQNTEYYRNNKWPFIKNVDDYWAQAAASDKYDPFVKWTWVDWPRVSSMKPTRLSVKLVMLINIDGVLAWIAMGVNLTANVPQHDKRSFLDDHLEY